MRVFDADKMAGIAHDLGERKRENGDFIGSAISFEVERMMRELPAIDAEPVRHGRWDEIPNTYMSVASKDGSYSGNATSCSVCHEVNPNAYKTAVLPQLRESNGRRCE